MPATPAEARTDTAPTLRPKHTANEKAGIIEGALHQPVLLNA